MLRFRYGKNMFFPIESMKFETIQHDADYLV